MSELLLFIALLALGPFLLIEGLLARYELMVYTIGWRAPAATLPPEMPCARGADSGRPPDAYVVYLDGIGKRRFTDTRDGGELVKAVIAGAPELRVLSQVQPYSPLAEPLVGRPVWDWLRRHAGITLFLHNVMQTFVAADRRYRPLYNRAVGTQIANQLRLAGYEPASGISVVLLCYSGGAQLATGAVEELFIQLRSPLRLITIGGFHNGANDLTHALHLYRLTSANDWIERVGVWLFPHRWRVWRRSAWNQALDAGKITVHTLDPAAHVGPQSYISLTARLADGRSYLDRTTETVIEIIRRDCTTT
ncbi:hypothetical protein CN187_16735 [Sinorhizobium meliloti]|uniref:hypothetical protein n=1 Tax=Rhizobium meliloti TaxID=382 RepID=UPI000FD96D73|nr:hypothetical protein [Sinorhizobium meliloti]MDE3819606.1 hypothetical protein [Sinorhizobium meliloti]MDW9985674.1 hypothetical protein [Sinorhizobium meliloti]MDX0271469.1 hypothetical protein [Sinorhizobium meliloti]MQX73302.1 hypothetical protein [Sinorhizobium meliloti]RVI66566.1 hypothetical protein CN187_16735 [Sinorhizobium meliloti]